MMVARSVYLEWSIEINCTSANKQRMLSLMTHTETKYALNAQRISHMYSSKSGLITNQLHQSQISEINVAFRLAYSTDLGSDSIHNLYR